MTYGVEPSEDLDEITDILTAAFEDDPVISWMVPHGLPRRERYIGGFMHAWVDFMLRHEGAALLSPCREAVMVWEPSERDPITPEDDAAFHADIVARTGPAAERCLQLIEVLDARYPPGLPPHLHGALAAVRPGTRSRGAFIQVAAEMARYILPRKLGVYCEASSDSSCALWQRMGARPIGHPILLTPGDVPVTPLFIDAEEIARHPAVPLILAGTLTTAP